MSRGSKILEIYKRLPRKLLLEGILTEKVYLQVMKEIETAEKKVEHFNIYEKEIIDKYNRTGQKNLDSSLKLIDSLSRQVGKPSKRPTFPLVVYFVSIIYRERLQRNINILDKKIDNFAKKFDKGELTSEDTRLNLENKVKARDLAETVIESLNEWEPEFFKFLKHYIAIKSKVSTIAAEKSLELKMKNIELFKLKRELDNIVSSANDRIVKIREDLEYFDSHYPELPEDCSLNRDLLKEIKDNINLAENTFNEEYFIPIKYDLDSDLRVLINILPAFDNLLTKNRLMFEKEIEFPSTYINTKRKKRVGILQSVDTQKITEKETLPDFVSSKVPDEQPSSVDASTLGIVPAYSFPSEEKIDEKNEDVAFTSEIGEIVTTTSARPTPSQPIDPWQFTGRIIMDEKGKSLGSGSYPYLLGGEQVISYYAEKKLSKPLIEILFRELLDQEEIPDSTEESKELVSKKISRELEVPIEASLLPSVVLEYFGKANIELENESNIKDSLGDLNYLFLSDIILESDKSLIKSGSNLSEEEVEQLSFLPPPKSSIGGNVLDFTVVKINKPVGVAKQIINQESIGHIIGIEQDRPSQILVRKILKTRRQATGYSDPYIALQSIIAKKIDAFEGESLLYWNLWKYCWMEKIPIMPWDILQEFVAFIPIIAVENVDFDTKTIFLKRGSILLKAKNLFRNLSFYTIINMEGEEAGKALGISVNENGELEFLWCALGTDEIIKKMRKPATTAAKNRLKKRIGSALKVKKADHALLPTNLFKYFLFYATFQDFKSMFEAMSWLKENFDLRSTPFTGIKRYDFTRKLLYMA
ncbi:MAG: hypothetical protein ACXAEU_02060 [Candidatus Hodarchaeales archaeon]|jgi:hypothetical protein